MSALLEARELMKTYPRGEVFASFVVAPMALAVRQVRMAVD
jgi:hypothetical protein